MIGDILIFVILGYIVYYTYKYLIGSLAPIITGIVAVYVVYLIMTRVMFFDLPPSIKIPNRYIENDKQIEQYLDERKDYEYRDIK